MRSLWRDFKVAVRVLRKSPAFAAVAVLTLGLGIATTTTVFGWIDAVLLHPMPGASNASELAALEWSGPGGGRLNSFPHPDFRDYQRELTLASGAVAINTSFFTIGPPESARRVMGQVVSANLFQVLGVRPTLGRVFSPEEDRDTPGAYPIAVISHRLWRTYFRENPGVVGRTVRLNGRQFTIIGVADPQFGGTYGGAAFDVWVPLSMAVQTGHLNTWAANDRNARFLNIIVRRKPGVSLEQLREEVRAVSARIAADYPDTHRKMAATAVPMWRASFGLQSSLSQPLQILMGAGILVLLIACANVANLLMARAVSRHKEFGIRIALGAGRGQLVRQVLTEVLVLAGAGALVGVLLAQWMGESMFYAIPALDAPVRAALQPLLQPRPSLPVLGYAILTALAAAVISTVVPAWHTGRVDVNEGLKESGRGGGSGLRSHRARAALVVSEVALAAMALVSAALGIQSFQKLSRVNLGFDTNNVLVAHFHLSTNGYSLDREKQFARDLRLRLEGAPGIEQVSYADAVPLSIFGFPGERVQASAADNDTAAVVVRPRTIVAPGYFTLMRIPMLMGRDFTEQDDRKAEQVIVVNQTFARRHFGELPPLGRKLRISGAWATVIGVVADTKVHNPAEEPPPAFYGSFRQMFWSGHQHFLYIRAANLDTAWQALRREAAAMDPNKALYDAATLSEYTQAGTFGERVVASLLSALSLLALALASVGLYSVMAYTVNERTQEIGVRMALGAQQTQVLGMVLRQGLVLTGAGLVAGTGAALALARVLASRSSDLVGGLEPAVILAPAACLILSALLATYLPARRATRVDPMSILRSE